jgi:hypothetical protein
LVDAIGFRQAFRSRNYLTSDRAMALAIDSQIGHSIPTSRPLLRAGVLVILAVVICWGGLFYVKAEQRRALDEFIRYAMDQADWTSFQLEAERFRLEIALSREQGDATALAEARQRYRIFASRLPALLRGDTRSLLKSMPAYSVAIAKVSQFLDRFDPVVADGLIPVEVPELLEACVELSGPLTVLSNTTMHARTISDLVTRDRVQLFDRAAQAIHLLLIALIGGFALYAILMLSRALTSAAAAQDRAACAISPASLLTGTGDGWLYHIVFIRGPDREVPRAERRSMPLTSMLADSETCPIVVLASIFPSAGLSRTCASRCRARTERGGICQSAAPPMSRPTGRSSAIAAPRATSPATSRTSMCSRPPSRRRRSPTKPSPSSSPT